MPRMVTPHLVRLGFLGHVGRFLPVEAVRFPRGSRVVCRTRRGLEVGQVLAAAGSTTVSGAADGELLRKVTVEDDLLLVRLERRKQEAFEACGQLLADRGIPAVLMDVEHLFDGRSLYFYFLGTPPAAVESLTDELAAAYGAAVQFQQFADTLEAGCGPQCGTDEAAGCGTAGGCSTCSLASACGKKH